MVRFQKYSGNSLTSESEKPDRSGIDCSSMKTGTPSEPSVYSPWIAICESISASLLRSSPPSDGFSQLSVFSSIKIDQIYAEIIS